jgi:predicted transcriptional regulator
MVKFGRHLDAFLAENQGSNLYVVPYSEIRDHLVEKESASPVIFTTEWTSCLEKAKADFDHAMEILWQMVFEGISSSDTENSRGASPDTAFRMFLSHASVVESQELLSHVKYTCETSLTNAEALRKLVKKFDKQHIQTLSLSLLPKLYAANFTVGQPTLEDGLVMLRETLETDFDPDEPPPQSHETSTNSLTVGSSTRRGQQHDAAVNRRREELAWLKDLVASIAPSEIQHIVAHRGFHNPLDRSDKRPLENSLAAYEAAWVSSVSFWIVSRSRSTSTSRSSTLIDLPPALSMLFIYRQMEFTCVNVTLLLPRMKN